jgi:uncharacterized protein YwqG
MAAMRLREFFRRLFRRRRARAAMAPEPPPAPPARVAEPAEPAPAPPAPPPLTPEPLAAAPSAHSPITSAAAAGAASVAASETPPAAADADTTPELTALRRLVTESLSPPTAAQLLALATPAIALVPDEPDSDPAGSHLGGAPVLPARMPWPHRNGVPLSFLLQVRLEEVAPYDADEALPAAGLLLFFYGGAEEAWGFDPDDRPSWRVLLVDPAGAAVRTAPDGAEVFGERRLRPAPTITLPDRASSHMQDLRRVDRAVDEVLARWHAERTSGGHRLLGWPHDGHDEMQRVCQLAASGRYAGAGTESAAGTGTPADGQWRLLLQLDNDDDADMVWGDECRLYFWLPAPLGRRGADFSPAATWLVWRCG